MLPSQGKSRITRIFKVSLVSAIVNTLSALLKIVVGIGGHSQVLIADGLHSLSDLLTDGLVALVGHLGAQSPDKEHPYGHRRIETIGTILISFILIIVAIGLAFNAFHQWIHHQPAVIPSLSVIIMASISIITNEALFRYTLNQGKRVQSDLLYSNAWHHRSDALISLIVLASVVGAYFGFPYLDSIGAFIVAILILRVGIKMISNNVKELIDTAVDDDTLALITNCTVAVPGVLAIHQLRTRFHGKQIFVDVHIQVAPNISVSEGHYIGEQVHLALIKKFPQLIDVTVHIDPENDATTMPSIDLPARPFVEKWLKKQGEHLPGFKEIRHIGLHYLKGKLNIELYLPLAALNMEKERLETQYQAALQAEKSIGKIHLYFE